MLDAEDKERWLKEFQKSSQRIVVIHVPQWGGISKSTKIFFKETFPLQPNLTQQHIDYYTDLFKEANVEHIILSGGEWTQLELVHQYKKANPNARLDVIWHGNYLQFSSPYDWASFERILNLHNDGLINKIGVLKKGMEEFLSISGYRSKLLSNYIPLIAEKASIPFEGGPHIGIWTGTNNWKIPFAMLAALKFIPGSLLYATGVTQLVKNFVDHFKIPYNFLHDNLISPNLLEKIIEKMHLCLYITIAECSPMMPIESLSLGVPCLIGPNNHLFEDAPYLHSRLVVDYPERADVIARYISQALEERENIVLEYGKYAKQYNEKSKEFLAEFLAYS